jgi:hypothetical protein
MPDDNEVKRQELRAVFQDLYNSLRAAIWTEASIEAKDKLIKLKEDVSAILTTLNRADIESRTQEFMVLCESIKTVNARLDGLKKEIDGFVHNFQVASQIVAKIDKVIDVASKYII